MITIDHEGVVYDPLSDRIHRLNPVALLVWHCCDGTVTTADLATDLAAEFSAPPEIVAASLRAVIADFAEAGLLDGAEPVTPPAATSGPTPTARRQPPPVAKPLRRVGPLHTLDASLWVECHDSPELAAEIARIAHSFAAASARSTAPAADTSADSTVVVWHDGIWHLDLAGEQSEADDESMVVDYLLWTINHLAVGRSSRYLILHAAALARDGRAVVLPATANSGKSTLAALLVQAGFDYLTDETAAIDLDTGEVVAYPKPITLDPGSQHLLPGLDPGGLTGSSNRWHVPADDIRHGSVIDRAVLSHIVFPTFETGADNELRPIATIDTVLALAHNSLNLAHHAHRLSEIVDLTQQCSRHTLRHDGPDAPVRAIASLF